MAETQRLALRLISRTFASGRGVVEAAIARRAELKKGPAEGRASGGPGRGPRSPRSGTAEDRAPAERAQSGTASSGGRTFVVLIRTFVVLIAFRGLQRARGLIW